MKDEERVRKVGGRACSFISVTKRPSLLTIRARKGKDGMRKLRLHLFHFAFA